MFHFEVSEMTKVTEDALIVHIRVSRNGNDITNLTIRQMNQRWNERYQIMPSQTPYNLIIYDPNEFTMRCNDQILATDQFDSSQNSAYFSQRATIVILIGGT